MTVLAAIIDTGALLEVVWVSFAAGVGLTLAFSLAIAAASRATQQRRGGTLGSAIAWWVVTAVCALVCAAAVVTGVTVMLSK